MDALPAVAGAREAPVSLQSIHSSPRGISCPAIDAAASNCAQVGSDSTPVKA